MSSSVPTLTDGVAIFFFLAPHPNRGFILTSQFTVLTLIKVMNASTYKLNIHSCYISPRWLLYDYDMTEVNSHMEPLTDPWRIYNDILADWKQILIVVVLGSYQLLVP